MLGFHAFVYYTPTLFTQLCLTWSLPYMRLIAQKDLSRSYFSATSLPTERR
jgi:hypothetical protein